MENYYISLFDKENKRLSNRVPLKDIIYNQSEVVFEFESDEIGTETLPYDDFLFYSEDYQVVFENNNKE